MKKIFGAFVLLAVFSSALHSMEDTTKKLSKCITREEIDSLKVRIEMVESRQQEIMNILRGQPELVVTGEVLEILPAEKRTPAQEQLEVFRTYVRDMNLEYVLPSGEFNVALYLARKEAFKQFGKAIEESQEGYRTRERASQALLVTKREYEKRHGND